MEKQRWGWIAGLAALTSVGNAAWRLEEVYFNPHGVDQGAEFVELAGDPGESANGVWLLVIGGSGSMTGVVTQAYSFQGRSAGANGLLLIRDTTAVLQPPPHAATSVMVQDFDPDLPNGSATLALVTGFLGFVGQDLDGNDDGVFETSPWTTALYGIGVPSGLSTFDRTYGARLNGVDFSASLSMFRQAVTRTVTGDPILVSIRSDSPPRGPFALQAGSCFYSNGAAYAPTANEVLTPGQRSGPTDIRVSPASFSVISGIPLGGSLASLQASDNQRLMILCDENEPQGRLLAGATSPLLTPSWMRWELEHVSVRDDLLVFFEAQRATDGVFVEVAFSLSSLTDRALAAESFAPAAFVGPQGQLAARVTWIPSADLDAGDGWSVGLDLLEWRVRA